MRNGTAVDQVARQYAFDYDDPADAREAMAYRDSVMVENTLWWLRQTGDRAMPAAHNGHVYLEGFDPDYPVAQGGLLRRALGNGYRAVGLAFGRGAFLATDKGVADSLDEDVKTLRSGPPAAGSVEQTRDRVSHRNCYLDLRTAPPAARTWLDAPRPKRGIGTPWPRDPDQVNLLRANAWALHGIAERLLEAESRGMWEKPDAAVLDALRQVYLETEGDLEGGE